MIRIISLKDTLPLRSCILRNGLRQDQCINDQDRKSTTIHLGNFNDRNELVCILTLQKEDHPKLPKEAYRLRGMATSLNSRRKGYARDLLNYALVYLKDELQVEYLWFNARKVAFPFYESMGFEYMSDEFDIIGIGPHKEMFIAL